MSFGSAFGRADRWQAAPRRAAFRSPFIKKFVDDHAAGLGAQVARWGFFSVFSVLLAFASILGFRIPERSLLPGARARLHSD